MNTSSTADRWVAASTGLQSKITVLSDGVDEFVSWVFEQEKVEASLDYAYEILDRDLRSGRISRIDRVLQTVRKNYLDQCVERPAIALGFLTQTGFERAKLSEWSQFKSALYDAISRRYSMQEADAILGHLP